MSYKLITASAHDTGLPAKSIHLGVTSPPYYGLRAYDGDQDVEWQPVSYKVLAGLPAIDIPAMRCGLGAEPTPEAFIGHLMLVMREMWRVLRDDGVFFVNLGDSYYGSSQTGGTSSKEGSEKRKGRMFKRSSSVSNVQHVGAYDTFGKALADFQDRDCLCGSLCDGCRLAYRTGKVHNGFAHDPKLTSLLYAPIHAHKVSGIDHLPTSDSDRQPGHTLSAILDSGHSAIHEGGPLLSSQESTRDLSSLQLLGAQTPTASISLCQLCGRSVAGDVHLSADKTAYPSWQQTSERAQQDRQTYTFCNGETGDSSDRHITDKVCDFCSYLDYTTINHHKQSDLKPKDMMMIPSLFALAARAEGWYLRSNMPWIKRNGMPDSTADRPSTVIENIFMLAKSEKYFFDMEAVKQPVAESSKGRLSQNIENQTGTPRANGGAKTNGNLKAVGSIENGRNFRSSDFFFRTWQGMLTNEAGPLAMVVNTKGYKEAHFATWPLDMVTTMIKAGTSERGVCPACGAPWARVTEKIAKSMPVSERHGRTGHNGQPPQISGNYWDGPVTRATGDWRPTCPCGEVAGHPSVEVPFTPGGDSGYWAAEPIPATVLDPFNGSGTSGRAALQLNRSYIGIDICKSYLDDLAPARLGNVQIEMAL